MFKVIHNTYTARTNTEILNGGGNLQVIVKKKFVIYLRLIKLTNF